MFYNPHKINSNTKKSNSASSNNVTSRKKSSVLNYNNKHYTNSRSAALSFIDYGYKQIIVRPKIKNDDNSCQYTDEKLVDMISAVTFPYAEELKDVDDRLETL